MKVGAAIRKRLGPLELPVSTAYRARFVDLEALARQLRSIGGGARIVEIGCGDGLLTTHLRTTFPDAYILGIDIFDNPGRLFRGAQSRVEFRTQTVEELRQLEEEPFALVIVADVLHHIPRSERGEFLIAAHGLSGADGTLVIKEWERRRNVAHLLAWLSDRYLTGDEVWFETRESLEAQIRNLFPDLYIRMEGRVRPRPNNLVLSVRHH